MNLIVYVVYVLDKPDVVGILLTIAVFITGIFFSMRLQYIHGFQNWDNQACTHWEKPTRNERLVKLYLERANDYRGQAAFLGRRLIEMGASILFMLAAMLVALFPNTSNCAQITVCVFIILGVLIMIISSISVLLKLATDCQCNEFLFCQGLARFSPCFKRLINEKYIDPAPLAQKIISKDMRKNLEKEIEKEIEEEIDELKRLRQHEERDISLKDCLKRLCIKMISKGKEKNKQKEGLGAN